jgi:membrane-bound lytic murein transglycosylase D
MISKQRGQARSVKQTRERRKRSFASYKRSLFALLCAFFLGGGFAVAQEDINLDNLADSALQWAKENLDDDILKSLQESDQRKVKEFLQQLQKQLQGEYVIDLAQLKEAARTILPLLESYEETLPYALWLKTRLDYLEVADQLRLIIPPPKTKPDQPPVRPVVPAPRLREIWTEKLVERPWPENARPYVGRLKPIFSSEQIPPELVWIAEVESSFDPRARSPAGAAGLFQLMPTTAKSYGLSTWPLDQRLKPEPSAHAAAQYLRHLHAHYKDWRLAIAAYNAGEGTVDGLLARHKAHSFDAIAAHLPAETQMYVPKVEATLARREGAKLANL